MNLKGSLPLLVLNVLADGPNHGYQIAKLIKDRSDGVLDFKEGTLYPALHALEKQRLIEAAERTVNGRQRRYYHITDSGLAVLAEQQAEWSRYAEAVNRVLRGNEA
ncbi:MAG: helix-turn-helix transcriptional regulator [Anaerolineae bacterium]